MSSADNHQSTQPLTHTHTHTWDSIAHGWVVRNEIGHWKCWRSLEPADVVECVGDTLAAVACGATGEGRLAAVCAATRCSVAAVCRDNDWPPHADSARRESTSCCRCVACSTEAQIYSPRAAADPQHPSRTWNYELYASYCYTLYICMYLCNLWRIERGLNRLVAGNEANYRLDIDGTTNHSLKFPKSSRNEECRVLSVNSRRGLGWRGVPWNYVQTFVYTLIGYKTKISISVWQQFAVICYHVSWQWGDWVGVNLHAKQSDAPGHNFFGV